MLYVAPQVGKGIRDSNKSNKKLGKMVVLPNGISIKHGKYESSHLSRRKLDFLHLRYESAKEKGRNIFPDVFIKSYKLDLSSDLCDTDKVRKLESKMNKYIKDLLSEKEWSISSKKQKTWKKKYSHLKDDDFRGNRGDWRQLDFDSSDENRDLIIDKGEEILGQLKKALEKEFAKDISRLTGDE